jgi:hypothetical protein
VHVLHLMPTNRHIMPRPSLIMIRWRRGTMGMILDQRPQALRPSSSSPPQRLRGNQPSPHPWWWSSCPVSQDIVRHRQTPYARAAHQSESRSPSAALAMAVSTPVTTRPATQMSTSTRGKGGSDREELKGKGVEGVSPSLGNCRVVGTEEDGDDDMMMMMMMIMMMMMMMSGRGGSDREELKGKGGGGSESLAGGLPGSGG